MSKLNQEIREEHSSSSSHRHSNLCDHAHHSHGLQKRPASSGEKVAYTYRREEKRESKSSGGQQTPRETPPSRKNVKWSDRENKENIDIDFLPDPDLDKGKFIFKFTYIYFLHPFYL